MRWLRLKMKNEKITKYMHLKRVYGESREKCRSQNKLRDEKKKTGQKCGN